MLKSLREWVFGRPSVVGEDRLRAWAEGRGWVFKRSAKHDGFIIETPDAAPGWRIEWGPSARRYIGSHELRLRGDTGIDPQTHALVMPKPLLDALEREIYSQYTDNVQTRLDEETPEEMRWLAMSPRLLGGALGSLRGQFAVVGNVTPWMTAWIGGPLGDAFLVFAASLQGDPTPVAPLSPEASSELSPQPITPMAMIARRSELILRVAMPVPHLPTMEQAVVLFDLALREARRFGEAAGDA